LGSRPSRKEEDCGQGRPREVPGAAHINDHWPSFSS
jgi:hypothetical protein